MATNWICVSIVRSLQTDTFDLPKRQPLQNSKLTPSSLQNYAVVQATLPGIENLGYKFWIVWVPFPFHPIPSLSIPSIPKPPKLTPPRP